MKSEHRSNLVANGPIPPISKRCSWPVNKSHLTALTGLAVQTSRREGGRDEILEVSITNFNYILKPFLIWFVLGHSERGRCFSMYLGIFSCVTLYVQ